MRLWYCSALLWAVSTALPVKKQYSVAPELLPGLSEIKDKAVIPEMYAGHMPLAPFDGQDPEISYFFWKFARPDKDLNTLIIWLNGGPGCSSMDGALVENGPFRVNEEYKLRLNEGSWHTKANMLYVDQPVNTGFSIPTGKEQIFDDDLSLSTQHFLQFLESYFETFPDDQTKDLIIAGESYSGQYIPFIADAIQQRNEAITDESKRYNLRGLLIGNGWMDPDAQSLAYLPFAISKNIVDQQNPYFSTLLKAHESCQNSINNRDLQKNPPFSYQECEDILQLLLAATKNTSSDTPADQVCLNVYSYNLRDSYPACGMGWPQDVLRVPGFFARPGVLEALNVDPDKVPQWTECNMDVYSHLKNNRSVPSIHKLPGLLDSGLEVILYNGEMDLLCNDKGVLDMIHNLHWGGQSGFSNSAAKYGWTFADLENNINHTAGHITSDRNLTFISVHNASHMVPNDKPLISRGVLDIYLRDTVFEESNGEGVLVTTSSKDADSTAGSKNLGVLGASNETSSSGEKQDSESSADSENGKEDENKDNGKDNDKDNDKDDADQRRRRRQDTFKVFAITVVSVSLVVSLGLYIYVRKHSKAKRAGYIDPNRRQNPQGKKVSWADDLERTDNLDTGHGQPSSAQSASQKKNSYTQVPNTELDESFELENF
ncbi:probable Pheromone-processing carboxypeptidase KEX1 [Zygosaccharomyces bailii ISA1307]|nr:probable Pheromone-processing carboxypeptidase KEX1 [Zygosaccharomyces bailii ISA1307]